MSKIPFHAFRINYPVRTRELVTKIGIRPVSLDSHSTNVTLSDYFHAVWDTGATGSVISSAIVQKFNLIPMDKTTVYGVNSQEEVNVYLVDIGLPNKVLIPGVVVMECNLNSPGIDILIGMDIIQQGDFSISNPDGKTVFSFCIPSHDNPVDLVEKSNRINQRKN